MGDSIAIQGVFATEEGHSSFSYTAGLTGRGWPELIVLGPDLDQNAMLLEAIVEVLCASGEPPTEGDLPDFLGAGHAFRLRACDARSDQYPFSAAWAISPLVTGMQVLIPDDEDRYPGDEGANDLTWQKLVPAPTS